MTIIMIIITKGENSSVKLAPSYLPVKEVGRFDADGAAEKVVVLVAGDVDAFKGEDVR